MKTFKKYKYLNYVPLPVNLDTNLYDLVDDEEFCQLDGRIPLLIATQHGIFPAPKTYRSKSKLNYRELEGLYKQQFIGFVGRGYLSNRERDGVFVLFIGSDTISRIRRNEICIDLSLWNKKEEVSGPKSPLTIMDKLISSSDEYELIVFNPDIPLIIKGYKKLGIVEIRGKAVFNNVDEGDKLINTPVIEWVENYMITKKPIYINFFLESLNIFSAHPLSTVFRRIAELNKIHNSIEINWYYSIDNELILEAGNDHAEIAQLPFNFIII